MSLDVLQNTLNDMLKDERIGKNKRKPLKQSKTSNRKLLAKVAEPSTVLSRQSAVEKQRERQSVDHSKANERYAKFCASRNDSTSTSIYEKIISTHTSKQTNEKNALNSYRKSMRVPWNEMITGRHKFATKHGAGESSKNDSSVFSDADFAGWAKDQEQRTLAKKRRLRL